MSKPKILILDIETRPALSYHWRMFKENIGIDQVKEPGGILCVGAKWLGDKEVMMFSEWGDGEKEMLTKVHALMSEADAVVGKNSDKFDLPWLRAEFLKVGLRDVSITSIDLEKVMRSRMRFLSHKLDFVAQYLSIGRKVEHEGFKLWRKVMEGNERARLKMLRYCAGDVRVTERLYKKLIPFINNHPHLGAVKSHECGACGSHKLHSRGVRRTKSFIIQRLQCQACGSWSDGSRKKVT